MGEQSWWTKHKDFPGFVCLNQKHMKISCFVADTEQAHSIPLFHMQPLHATLCFKDFCNPTSPPWSCMQSQYPSLLHFHGDDLHPSSLRFIPFHSHSSGFVHFVSWLLSFNLSLFSSFYLCLLLPSPFMSLLPDQLLFFIFLPFSWRKDSSGCMPDRGKMGRMREGILLRWNINVAAFAVCIPWTLCVLCYSSHCPNWLSPLMPRTCTQ